MGTIRTFLAILFVGALLSGCGAAVQKCVRVDFAPVVDADLSDWPILTPKETAEPLKVRAAAVGDALYLSVYSKDPETVRSIVAGGLDFQFDPRGGKERALSLRFPSGLGAAGDTLREAREKTLDLGDLPAVLNVLTEDLTTVEATGNTRVWSMDELRAEGVEAKAALRHGEYVCEMKIPLGSPKLPFSLLAPNSGKKMGLRLATVRLPQAPQPIELASAKPLNEAWDGPPGGGMRGGMGRGAGHGGRGRGGAEGGHERDKATSYETLDTYLRLDVTPFSGR